MKSIVKLTYHGVIYSKKNNKRIVTNKYTQKPIIVSSVRAKSNEWNMADEFKAQALEARWQPEEGARYVVRIKIWEKDRTRRDLDNQATSILDALVLAGIIPDDSVSCVVKLSVAYMGIDKYDPHADIIVAETIA